MYELVFATHNKNKRLEIQSIIPNTTLKDLDDIGIKEEIPENETTLEGNALAKARFVKGNCGLDCFADDTGLEVDALDGEPGVYSARYAGSQKNADDNMNKLLANLVDKKNRNARFRTVVALIQGSKEYLFEGVVEGRIIYEKRGLKGFGYDPIFIPDGFDKTFAEMTLNEKNTISHRKRAVQKLVDFLQES